MASQMASSLPIYAGTVYDLGRIFTGICDQQKAQYAYPNQNGDERYCSFDYVSFHKTPFS